MNTTTTLASLKSTNFKLGSNYLEVTQNLTNDEWKAAFSELISLNECTNWWIGDFLNAIEAAGKDILSTIGDAVGYDWRSLENMKSLSKKIPKDKRIDNVSFTHHRYAWIETKNLDAMVEELKLARTGNKTVLEMRDDIRDKSSDKTKTSIPAVTRSKKEILLTEASNGITAIRRLINNGYNKLEDYQKSQFVTEFFELVDLVEEEIN